MTTFGKLTRFNFLKTKKTQHNIQLFLPSTIQLYPNILRPNRVPWPEAGAEDETLKTHEGEG